MANYNNPYPQPEEEKWGEDPGAEDARGRFLGPVGLFGKRDADANWDQITSIYDNANDPAWNGAQYAISADDIGRPHTIVVTFES